jgi:hypothetical protein
MGVPPGFPKNPNDLTADYADNADFYLANNANLRNLHHRSAESLATKSAVS